MRKQIIAFPYYGIRGSCYVYHPAKHGPSTAEGAFEAAAQRFHQLINDFVAVAELYTDQQVLSESVGGQPWKRDILKLFNAIEKDGKDVYVLEAAAECIFDRESKIEQRFMPSHEEVKKMAGFIRADDINITMGAGPMDPKNIIDVGFTGR